jgi:UDP-N-acetylmuramoyl-L-alanyl-D-glutamate--2,6-diaminopimelate ligase
MHLTDLIADLPQVTVQGTLERSVSGIYYDSRQVEKDGVFVCISGFKTDGHKYVFQAVEKGATVIVAEKDIALSSDITVLKVPDTRLALALLANAYYDYPSRKFRLIGVTGTNGKTSVTYLIRAILKKAGQKVGLLGTIANLIDEQKIPSEHTTPESSDLQHLFSKMREQKVDSAVMEVSSHALELKRVAGSEYDVAVFTNLTQDHLDFHPSLEAYLEAKAKLFKHLGPGWKNKSKYAVLNWDDPSSKLIASQTKVPIVTYGVKEGATYRAEDIELHLTGTSFVIKCPAGAYSLHLNLAGEFNVYNALAAFAVGMEEGIESHLILEALEEMKGVPGRFEQVDCGQDFAVIVDYAHTPDGLENLLKTARAVTKGKVITVFGCGGDRDKAKRPIMGRVASSMSDYCIVTSDNPRTEEPRSIIKDIEGGLVSKSYEIIVDRRDAIARAVECAQKGDMVVIAGKGHEDYQIIGNKIIPFDDRKVARDILTKRGSFYDR